ncbi:hypothetical protein ACNOYE_16705 [Nannocystaceae bacterium ST9]
MPRSTHVRLVTLAGMLVAAAGLGCAMDLPEPGLIIDTRVLAIKTSVTGPLIPDPADAETPKAQALPFETVTIEPFVVGPEGPIDPDSIDPVWIACELSVGQGLFACIQAAMPLSLDELPECEIPSFEDIDGTTLPEPVSPCLIGRTGIPEYTVPLSANVFIGGAIELTMIAGSPIGTSTDECAKQLLRGDYELPNDCIYAVQRLSVGPIEQLLALAATFGVPLEGFEVPDPEDIPESDRNPRITEVRVNLQDEEGMPIGESTPITIGEQVEVPLEGVLRIDVVSPEEDLQVFQVAVNNGESYEDRPEAYSGSWYRTWGTLLSGSSDDPASYNEWNFLPGAQDPKDEPAPPEDRALLYYVVRDGRQGVNWFWFEAVTGP